MANRKDAGAGDLIFNEDFDKEPEAPPPAPPVSQTPGVPPPVKASEPAPFVPEVADDAKVPAVSSGAPKTEPSEKKEPPTDEVVLEFTDTTAAPVTTGTIQPAGDDPGGPHDEETGAQQREPRFKWLSLKPFMRFFDVDDQQVLRRVATGLKGPFARDFTEDTRDNPDLYGPFWIATTLVFLTGVSSNISSYTDHKTSEDKHEDWDGDYATIGEAALLYYIYLFGVGLLLYFILRAYRSGMHLTHVWCIYGYALAAYLPAMVLIALFQAIHDDTLSDALTGLFAVLAAIYTGAFLVLNFREEVSDMSRGSALLLAMFVLHLVPACVMAFYFH